MEDTRHTVLSSYPHIGPMMRLLSTLLNSTKVLLTDGPHKRHRDWRGLASLINISSEVVADIASNRQDQTKQVWEIWRQTPGVTLGDLLGHLKTLDRYDAYDDILEFVRHNPPTDRGNQVMVQNNPLLPSVATEQVVDPRAITCHDGPNRYPEFHAYIIYAQADRHFVAAMKEYLERDLGFMICTKDDLLPGLSTEFAPVANLITYRCRRVIIVYSPDFLQSNENSYYADFLQADNIKKGRVTMVPLIIRDCRLPPHLATYVSLHISNSNFWIQLVRCLDSTKTNLICRIPPPQFQQMSIASQSTAHSAVNIVTASDSDRYSAGAARLHDLYPNYYSTFPRNQASLSNQVYLDNRQGRLTPRLVTPAHSQGNLAHGQVYLAPGQVHLASSQGNLAYGQGHLTSSQGNLAPGQVHMSPNQGHLNAGQVHLTSSQGNLAHGQVPMTPSQCNLTPGQGHLISIDNNVAHSQVHMTPSQGNLAPVPVYMTSNQGNLAPGQVYLISYQGNHSNVSVAASQAPLLYNEDLTGPVNQNITADSLRPVENRGRPMNLLGNAFKQFKETIRGGKKKNEKKASRKKKDAQYSAAS